jgi:hypothetical protein
MIDFLGCGSLMLFALLGIVTSLVPTTSFRTVTSVIPGETLISSFTRTLFDTQTTTEILVTTTLRVPTTETRLETLTQSGATSVQTLTSISTTTEGGRTITLPVADQGTLILTTTAAWYVAHVYQCQGK